MPKNWFPLESNPEVMNSYVSKLGMDVSLFEYSDVFSTEDWALEMVPKPCVGVLMLFPIKSESEIFKEEENDKILAEGQIVSPDVYFMKQTVGNACGTIGILHSIVNSISFLNISPDSYLSRLIEQTKKMTPDERAVHIEADDSIEEVHEDAASLGQSDQLDVDDVNSHFVCFSVIDGHLYELDGRKSFPINHGVSSQETLLLDACTVIRSFMARDPEETRFTIVALTAKNNEEES